MTTNPDICSMHLLLTAATAAEIQPGIDFLEKNGSTLPSYHAEALVTGVGAVATTYLLTKQINQRRPDLIIQAGIAGSFSNRNPGEVLSIKQDVFADTGVWENDRFNSIFDLNLANDNEPPFRNQWLVNTNEKLLRLGRIESVSAITVNEISTDATRIEWYRDHYSPAVESMEGAAFHYVCLRENIPFLQLRSVSNKVGVRDKSKWAIPEAINNLNEKIIFLLKEFPKYDDTYFRL